MQKLTAQKFDDALLKMEGISKDQVEQHLALYEGYVNKSNEILEKLESADQASANQTYSDLRELKVELSFALNGVKLHELYFENLGGAETSPGEKTKEFLARDFGSVEDWEKDLKASGLAARGWVILAYDPTTESLVNYLADDHNTYGIWGAVPILVLDTYEHAYMVDYGTKRAPYLDAFVANVDWEVVERRLAQVG